jgi:hypothetical protein
MNKLIPVAPITPQTSTPSCRHPRLRGPDFIGENGAYCRDCGDERPCPHTELQTEDLIGGDRTATSCSWCGKWM